MTRGLVVEELGKSFGGNRVVDSCSCAIEEGTITGFIGPNGAGKSTLFNLIGGQLRPDDGAIRWGDEDIAGLPPYRIARLGIARTFQIPRELKALSVLENLMIVPPAQFGERLRALLSTGRRVAHEEASLAERARQVLEHVELADKASEPAVSLSGGQKKLLELARCMMGEPRLILLDEPTAGVNPRLIGDIVEAMRRLRDQGITLGVIEHNMNVVMGLCDRVVVLNQGRALMTGTPSEVRNNPEVLDAYLGSERYA